MANTTNFGWETPDDTDLVKDGALAMRTLGNAIDTSLVDLKGGTSGQILAKNSNTDMDFVWIANDQGDITAVTAGTGISGGGTTGAVTITNSMATAIDAKGDLIVGTGADTFDRLAVGGTNGHVLTVDSSTSTGLKWAAAAGGGGFTLINTGGTALSGASVDVTGIPTDTTYKHLLVVFTDVYSATADGGVYIRPNNDTSNANYAYSRLRVIDTTVEGAGGISAVSFAVVTDRTNTSTSKQYLMQGAVWIYRYTDTDARHISASVYSSNSANKPFMQKTENTYFGTSAISSLRIYGDYNFSGGTVYVYGVN